MCRLFLMLLLLCPFSSGCTMFEHLKPHQLWKLNRQKAPSSESADGYFQIPAVPQSTPHPAPDQEF